MRSLQSVLPPKYFQYLISYVIVLFIPLFIIGMFVYSNMVKTVQEQAVAANGRMLEQTGDLIDTKFMEIANISTDLSTNPLISLSQFQDPLYYYSTRSMMNYRLSNTFLDDVILYDREREYLYSSGTSYSLDLFFQVFRFKTVGKEQFHHLLEQLDKPELLKVETENKEGYIMQLRPIPVYSYSPRGTAVFMMKEQVFKETLQSMLFTEGSEAFIADRTGVITGVYDHESIAPVILEELSTRNKVHDTFPYEISGRKVFVSYIYSNKTNFTYVLITPNSALLKDVNRMKDLALQALTLILLIGGAAIYFSMRHNYNPIRRVMIRIEKTWAGWTTERGFKKLEHFISAAEQLNRQNESNAPYVRERHLLHLLQGRFRNREEFESAGQAIGLKLDHAWYFIAAVQWDRPVSKQSNWNEGFLHLEETGHQVLRLQSDNGATLIISGDEEGALPRSLLLELQQWLSIETESIVTVGVGSAYEDILQLMKSYIEATAALQYKFIYGSGQVIVFEELEQRLSAHVWSPRPLVDTLLLHLERGAIEQASNTIEKLITEIREKSRTLFQAKSNCFEAINAIFHFVRERFDSAEYASVVSKLDMISYLNDDSIEYLLQELKDVCTMACGIVEACSRTEGANDPQWVLVMAYVQSNYLDYRFSLQQMADDLKLSVSTISRIFKEATGDTIMEHVNGMRLEKAKGLLQSTFEPVKEIVEHIGYKDVSSFIRKFKQQVGMTPIEYRNHCRRNKD